MADEKKAAFGQYTTGRKYQGAKKRAEKPSDVNLIKDPKTYAAVMGLLGERPDEMGFSALHPDYEAIRRVADPAFAIGTALGIAPGVSLAQKAATKGALALGRAGEQMAERAVPQIMGRGGLGADILSGLAQGTQSRIFIGPKAKTWNQASADAAVKMEKEGADPALIWQQTGTFRGADGILRQEIDDRFARFLTPEQRTERIEALKQDIAAKRASIATTPQKDLFPKALTEAKRGVRDEIGALKIQKEAREMNPRTQGMYAPYIFEHDELYKAYPELRDVKFVLEGIGGGQGTKGALSVLPGYGKQGAGRMEVDIYTPGLRQDPTSVSLHEMQHAVQTLEGMGPGGSPTMAFNQPEAFKILEEIRNRALTPMSFEEYAQKLSHIPTEQLKTGYESYVKSIPEMVKRMDREFQSQAAMEYYKRLAGEAEARATQDRQMMTKSQRMETPPPASYDVPQEDLIVKPPKTFAQGGKVTFADSPDAMRIEMAEGGKAAFGVFPQMKPRRSKQDREAAKNVPVDLARGVISGALGIPGDIESLARLPYQLITGQESPTILPTSEDIEKRLPFKSDTPIGGVATGLGQIAGGFATPAPAIRAAKKLRQTIGNLPPANPRMSQMGVIKAPGGNWLTDNVENAVRNLKRTVPMPDPRLQAIVGNPEYTPAMWENAKNLLADQESAAQRAAAINKWIDSNLTNYIKKQMATPDDPVRKLAEQGITHKSDLNDYRRSAGRTVSQKREQAGFPAAGLGESELARVWENLADYSFMSRPAKDVSVERYPWVAKLDPETPIYGGIKQDVSRELAFDHIVDVLRQDLAAGRIRPEQLNKVSMEQAVRRTYEYDQEMAKKMREAQIKATEGMPIYKEYPEGYKWMELAPPSYTQETLPPGFKLEQWDYKGKPVWSVVDEAGVTHNEAADSAEDAMKRFGKSKVGQKALEDALKYEGETMGHCVGGYCPDVLEGRSRIFSLRDAKGEPHVTVEVQPAYRNRGFREGERPAGDEYYQLQEQYVQGQKTGKVDPNLTFAEWWRSTKGIPEEAELAPQIVQIKGKQNRAPKEEYLPFVQDFVRGGQWSGIGDFGNTGLVRKSDLIDKFTPEQLDAVGVGEYLTKGEYDDLLLKALQPPAGMKKGGKVCFTDNPDAMRLELQMSVGGIAKRMAKTIGKAAESAGQKPPTVAAKDLTTLQDTHTMLGDKVRARAMQAQKQMDEWNYKYSPGQHVFTQHGASKNLPPLRILERARSGNQVMRQDHPDFGPGMGKPIIDPATGKAMRTPYEPGYRVRRQNSPDPEDYAEFIIPEKSIVGDVEMSVGGLAKLANLGRAPAKVMKKEAAKDVKPAFTQKQLESTAEKMADKIKAENPKLSDAEAMKKGLRQAEQKLKWEKAEKPALEKTYGALEKSKFSDPLARRQRNVPEVVEKRIQQTRDFLAQPVEPWTPPRKELQAFDRERIKEALEGFPGIEQTLFPRYKPARADLSHIEEIYGDPVNRELIKGQITRGLPLGGETFYASLYPLKLAALERGIPEEKFNLFVHSIAPASARNSIMNEMAVGQFLRDMRARGLPLDEDTVTREMAKFRDQYGTGLPLMPVHREGVKNVLEGAQDLRELLKADIPTNYKIPTYGAQKAGDFGKSVVLDVHEAAGQTRGSRYHPYFTEQGGFGPTEYGAAESKMLDIAGELGVPGGMAQAGRWFGGGELTGLKSPRGDALDLLERQAAYTLQGSGINPTPRNIRNYILNMIDTGEGVLMPWFKKEGMPDLRTEKKKGGAVHKAAGGEISADDLIIEERPL